MHDIRKAARVLRLGLPEGDIIQAILEGLHPQEISRLMFADRPRCFADLDRLCLVSRTVQAMDESRERAARGDPYSSSPLERAKNDEHGGWWRTQETVRKTEYSRSNGGYEGVARGKMVTTATAPKIKKYEIKRGRRSYIRESTLASREPVARRYSYLEKGESLNVPDELRVPDRVRDEEGEEEVEERNYFVGSTRDNKNTSVDTELQDSERTSWLNPDAAEFVPVSPSRFMRDPDPVISSPPTQGCEKSLESVALPSPVEFNLNIAHGLDTWIPGWEMVRTL